MKLNRSVFASHLRLDGHIASIVVLDGWNDRLYKLEKDHQVAVDLELFARLGHQVYQLFHDFGVATRMYGGHRSAGYVRMSLECDRLFGMIFGDVVVHLLDAQRLVVLVVAH